MRVKFVQRKRETRKLKNKLGIVKTGREEVLRIVIL